MIYPGPSRQDEMSMRTVFRAVLRSVAIAALFFGVLALVSDAHAQEAPTESDLALMGIDAVTIAKVWTWGFGTVIFSWYLGFVAGVALKAIRKA